MEVHAHTHTPRKKWTHYLWEFLMLFLAVFCGFLAENWREHIIEKEKGKQYIFSFYEDLKRDTASFARLIKQNETKLESFTNVFKCYDSIRENWHLDGDFISDENRVEPISEKRTEVLDLNYTYELRMKLFYASLSSLKNTNEYIEAASLKRTLLTKDINQVKNFVNLALIQQPHFHIRGDVSYLK